MATPVSLRTLLKTTILRKIDEERAANEEKKAHDKNLELLPTLINAVLINCVGVARSYLCIFY